MCQFSNKTSTKPPLLPAASNKKISKTLEDLTHSFFYKIKHNVKEKIASSTPGLWILPKTSCLICLTETITACSKHFQLQSVLPMRTSAPFALALGFWAEGGTFHRGLECGWISSPLIALLHPVFLMVTSAAAAPSSSLFCSSLSIQSKLIFSQETHGSAYRPHSQPSLVALAVLDILSQSCSTQFYIWWGRIED